MTQNNDNAVDILGFDAVAESQAGFEFELRHTDGRPTGVFFRILGSNADPVREWVARIVNKQSREAAIARKRGIEPETRTLEELEEQNIQGAVVRVLGWHGVKQEFSKEILYRVLRKNMHFVAQITSESETLGNFTLKPPTTSVDSQGQTA